MTVWLGCDESCEVYKSIYLSTRRHPAEGLHRADMDGSGRYSAHLGHPHKIEPESALWWYRSSGTVHGRVFMVMARHGASQRAFLGLQKHRLDGNYRLETIERHASPQR